MVSPATAPIQLLYWNTELMRRNSPTKPLVNGRATLPNIMITKNGCEYWRSIPYTTETDNFLCTGSSNDDVDDIK